MTQIIWVVDKYELLSCLYTPFFVFLHTGFRAFAHPLCLVSKESLLFIELTELSRIP